MKNEAHRKNLKEIKALRWKVITIIMILLSGCVNSRPIVKSNQTIIPGHWDFDIDSVGELPQGVNIFSGKWTVSAKDDAPTPPNVLCQIGQATYPALSLSNTSYSDFVMSISFKPVSGEMDQAAGIIFRIQDKDNYYILRANAIENNVNIYLYADGYRYTLKEGAASVKPGQWQKLRVEAIGTSIRGFLNDIPVVEITDNTYSTGKVGLWTKADSVTCFDNVTLYTLHQSAKINP